MENRFESGAPDSSVIDQEIKEISVANFSGHTLRQFVYDRPVFAPSVIASGYQSTKPMLSLKSSGQKSLASLTNTEKVLSRFSMPY